MARNLDAKCRQCRREGEKLFLKGEKCFTDKCPVERRSYAPGQHGQRQTRLSDYGKQLREKQKVRRIYGLLERQFRTSYAEADRRKGATGENLLQFLESRLDTVTYPHGLRGVALRGAPDRAPQRDRGERPPGEHPVLPAAPGRCGGGGREGQRPACASRPRSKPPSSAVFPEWLEVDAKSMKGVFKAMPQRSDLPPNINESLVVELYSK